MPVQVDVTALVNQAFNANGLATFQVYASSPASIYPYAEFASNNNGTAAWRPTLIVIPSGAAADTAVVNGATATVANAGLGIGGGPLVVENGGAVDLGQTVQNVGAVTLAGGTIGDGTLLGTAYNVSQGAIGANLAGQTAALVKSGPSTVVLSGANTYSGGTSVIGGTLIIASAASLPAGGSLEVGDGSLFASAGLALSQQVSQQAVSPSPAANPAAATTADVVASAAIVPPASLTTASASPAIPLDGQQQLRRTIDVGENVPSKSEVTWLPAIAQFWNEQRQPQPTGPAKARAVDIVMMTRNASQ